MRRAVGTHGTLHRIEGLQKRHDTQQTLPTLLCDSEGCGASVKFVAADPSYITLNKGAEHQPGCRYNAPGRMQAILAAGSDPEFLPSLDDGRHELRLLLLQQALKRGGIEQHTLDGYLGTLADLLVLRAMCESDDLVASQVTLRLGKKRVDWGKFLLRPGALRPGLGAYWRRDYRPAHGAGRHRKVAPLAAAGFAVPQLRAEVPAHRRGRSP